MNPITRTTRNRSEETQGMNRIPIISAILAFADKLRFRQLFLLVGSLFLIDLLIPDFIPLVDELLLGLLTLLLAAWKKERRDEHALEQDTGDNP
jgi:hypothetical protein